MPSPKIKSDRKKTQGVEFLEKGIHHPLSRLWRTILLLTLVVLIGALGYHRLGSTGYLDSFYMAIITLFTVGFRELGEVNTATKLFTIF
jgi:voltage-gated potassium channel